MFTFFHTYTPAAFPALVRSGLWRGGDGLKLMHKPGFRAPDDFNTALADGAPLTALLRELGCPFYIDRLQGGMAYTAAYPYDGAVIRRLTETLGDRFLGFQLHEWASNLRSDALRIRALLAEEGVSPTDRAAYAGSWRRVQSGALPLIRSVLKRQ